MIRNEVSGLEPLEKGQGIGAGEMPFTKTRLPPGCMSDRKKCQVETSSVGSQLLFDQVRGIGSKRGIAGKEAGGLISLY